LYTRILHGYQFFYDAWLKQKYVYWGKGGWVVGVGGYWKMIVMHASVFNIFCLSDYFSVVLHFRRYESPWYTQ